MWIAVVVGVICGIAAAVVAGNKGRHPLLWFGLGFLLPLVGLVAALVIAPRQPMHVPELATRRDDRGRHRLLGD